MPLSDYQAGSANWRSQLRKNERKTRIVIILFIVIYLGVGLIADVFILSSSYPRASLLQCFYALISFRFVPYATLIMGLIATLSLIITFKLYDRIMLLGTEYHEITAESAQNLQEKQVYHVVEEMKVAAGLRFMPKVFIIEANYMNAFASGYSEKSAMVAITRGLLEKLTRAELQAVMAHELSHIRHKDIKLTLTVAILSNIMLIAIDILFYSMLSGRGKREDNRFMVVIVVLRYILPLLTLVLTLFLSRTREYMADAGCIELMRDNEPMARALLKIAGDHQTHAQQYAQEYSQTAHEQLRQASYLFDSSSYASSALSSAFATHPAIDDRLAAIGFKRKV